MFLFQMFSFFSRNISIHFASSDWGTLSLNNEAVGHVLLINMFCYATKSWLFSYTAMMVQFDGHFITDCFKFVLLNFIKGFMALFFFLE